MRTKVTIEGNAAKIHKICDKPKDAGRWATDHVLIETSRHGRGSMTATDGRVLARVPITWECDGTDPGRVLVPAECMAELLKGKADEPRTIEWGGDLGDGIELRRGGLTIHATAGAGEFAASEGIHGILDDAEHRESVGAVVDVKLLARAIAAIGGGMVRIELGSGSDAKVRLCATGAEWGGVAVVCPVVR